MTDGEQAGMDAGGRETMPAASPPIIPYSDIFRHNAKKSETRLAAGAFHKGMEG